MLLPPSLDLVEGKGLGDGSAVVSKEVVQSRLLASASSSSEGPSGAKAVTFLCVRHRQRGDCQGPEETQDAEDCFHGGVRLSNNLYPNTRGTSDCDCEFRPYLYT